MSDDDRELPPEPPDDEESPPPATWAGRRRAQGEPEEPTDQAAGNAEDDPPEADEAPGEDEAPEEEAAEPDHEATVEADTLALSDREQAREEAFAGLKARTGEHEDELESAEEPAEPQTVAAAAVVEAPEASEEGDSGDAPRPKRLWARFLAASFLIIASMAAATSISLLVYLTDIAEGLSDNDKLASLRDQLTEVDGGDPQTILIIGSDKRLDTKGDPGRSDTAILLRVDPDKDRIALLSIPRDLKVNIPGVGVDKFNAAYSAGGPPKTFTVVEQITGLDINHVVNINFNGFADAVNAIGCVYIDVDRRYYIAPEDDIAEIDIEAGYQRLCGLKALQYVRFRHDDTDLVRSARQQDFLREARQKLPPGTLINDRNELLDIFTEYTTSDIGAAVPLLELLKTFAAVQSAPVSEVHFPADLGDGTSGYVTASDEAIKNAVDQFLNVEGTPGERPGETPEEEQRQPEGDGRDGSDEPGGSGGEKKSGNDKPDEPEQDFVGPTMDDSSESGRQFGEQMSKVKRKDGDKMIEFPIYYPTRLAPGSTLSSASRAFPIDGPDKEVYYGYKLVADFQGSNYFQEYYGVSGSDWVDAPILDNPSETRMIDGRDYLLFYDGDRLRLVGWKTKNAAYWVHNSLLQSLDEGQMLSIATSMRELD